MGGTAANFQFEDVFKIEGRGVVLTGKVITGSISIGSILNLYDRKYQVAGIEAFNQSKQIVNQGEDVSVLLRGADRDYAYFKTIKGRVLNFESN